MTTLKIAMTKQPKIGLLAVDTHIGWAWGRYVALFKAGTLCKQATNLPPDDNGYLPYWIQGKPESFCSEGQLATVDDFASWQETYGFKVSHSEIVGRSITKKKKR